MAFQLRDREEVSYTEWAGDRWVLCKHTSFLYLIKWRVYHSLIKASFNLLGKEMIWKIKNETQKQRNIFPSPTWKGTPPSPSWRCRPARQGWRPCRTWKGVAWGSLGTSQRSSLSKLLGGGFRNEGFSRDCPLRLLPWKMVPVLLWLNTGCCVDMSQIWGVLTMDDTGRILLACKFSLSFSFSFYLIRIVWQKLNNEDHRKELWERGAHIHSSLMNYVYILVIKVAVFWSLLCLLDHVPIKTYHGYRDVQWVSFHLMKWVSWNVLKF